MGYIPVYLSIYSPEAGLTTSIVRTPCLRRDGTQCSGAFSSHSQLRCAPHSACPGYPCDVEDSSGHQKTKGPGDSQALLQEL